MLTFAAETPTVKAAIAKITEETLAKIEVRFMCQNYRLTNM